MQENEKLSDPVQEEEQETGVIPADAGQEQEEVSPAPRMSWQEILEDPEYKRQFDADVQRIIQRRLRGRQDAEDALGRLSPVLDALREKYGEADEAELAESILCGASRQQREAMRSDVRQHYAKLMAEAELLRSRYPDFDLDTALSDPRFLMLSAPHTGLSLEDVYCAVHRQELSRAQAEQSMKAAVDTLRSGQSRPRELRGGQAGARLTRDPGRMSPGERSELKKRIYDAGSRGEKIPFGG